MKTETRKSLKNLLNNQKGAALVTVYMVSVLLSTIAGAAYSRALAQSRAADAEVNRIKSFAAAEAGLQSALSQIGTNAYTGYINTASISNSSFSSSYGNSVGTMNVSMSYPNSADWIIVTSSATVNGVTEQIEGRVFLDSNLSKYLIYANTPTLSLGTNLILGANDGTNPQGVSADENDRAATYHTQDLDFYGTNINVYGDVNAERLIDGSTNSTVHGDTYAGNFALNSNGTVSDDGVNGTLTVDDGFSDDTDRDGNGSITTNDYPDRHDLTSVGGGDSHKTETLDAVNTTFYKTYKDSALPSTWGTSSTTRYIELAASSDGTKTKVIEYTNSSYSTQSASYTLSNSNAIIYNNGSLYIKGGVVVGRVSVASADDIVFDGNVKYKNSASYSDSSNSAAFMAKDKVFVRPTSLEISGIVYAQRGTSTGVALDADYNTSGNYDPDAKADGHFRLYGNVIINGTANTADYANDREYVYDKNLKYFRPPGVPVRPVLRTVRES